MEKKFQKKFKKKFKKNTKKNFKKNSKKISEFSSVKFFPSFLLYFEILHTIWDLPAKNWGV
jgi:hypothetical protein